MKINGNIYCVSSLRSNIGEMKTYCSRELNNIHHVSIPRKSGLGSGIGWVKAASDTGKMMTRKISLAGDGPAPLRFNENIEKCCVLLFPTWTFSFCASRPAEADLSMCFHLVLCFQVAISLPIIYSVLFLLKYSSRSASPHSSYKL